MIPRLHDRQFYQARRQPHAVCGGRRDILKRTWDETQLAGNSAGAPAAAACVKISHMLIVRPLAAGDEVQLRRIHATPEVARWWDLPEDGFPFSDEPEATRLTIEVDGEAAGLIEFHEELEPRYRHASIDLFLDPALHGRGIGSEVLARVVRMLVEERSHHRITIDPAIANVAAIRSYEKVGFKAVGVMRESERDVDGGNWHDSLLMELLASEL